MDLADVFQKIEDDGKLQVVGESIARQLEEKKDVNEAWLEEQASAVNDFARRVGLWTRNSDSIVTAYHESLGKVLIALKSQVKTLGLSWADWAKDRITLDVRTREKAMVLGAAEIEPIYFPLRKERLVKICAAIKKNKLQQSASDIVSSLAEGLNLDDQMDLSLLKEKVDTWIESVKPAKVPPVKEPSNVEATIIQDPTPCITLDELSGPSFVPSLIETAVFKEDACDAALSTSAPKDDFRSSSSTPSAACKIINVNKSFTSNIALEESFICSAIQLAEIAEKIACNGMKLNRIKKQLLDEIQDSIEKLSKMTD